MKKFRKAIAILLIIITGLNSSYINVHAEIIGVLETRELASMIDQTLEDNAQIDIQGVIESDEATEIADQVSVLLNGNVECSSLSEALSLIDNSRQNEIKLLKDVKEDNSIVISVSTDISIDLNEFNLEVSVTAGGSSAGIINNGNLQIKGNGKIIAIPNLSSGSEEFSVIVNNGSGKLEVSNCTIRTDASISTTGSSNLAVLNVYGVTNSGECIVQDVVMFLNAEATAANAVARANCYGVYNKGGKSIIEEFTPINVARATAKTVYYNGDAVTVGIYCAGGEVDYFSGKMSLASISTTSASTILGSTYAIYNRAGTVNIGKDDDVLSEQPNFTEYVIATESNSVTNVYDGTYNSKSFLDGDQKGEINNYIEYEIEFYSDNILLKQVKCKMGEAIEEEIETPVKKGYIFKNWQTEDGILFNEKSEKYSSYKVYAVWEPIKIDTIIFALPMVYVDEYAEVMPYLAINENESVDLSKYILYSPEEYGMNDKLLWGASDEEKVEITDEGTVKGLKVGVVTVCAILSEDTDIQAFAVIEVKHVWNDEHTMDKEPTCEGAGSESIHCAICDIIKEGSNREVPALGHHVIIDEMIPSTCTTEGKTEGSYCSSCGYIFEEQKIIPATGHVEVIDAAIPPTYKEPGKTEGSHCSVCNTVIRAQEEIPILKYKISFQAGYGIEIPEQNIKEGEKIQEPVAPIREGYTFNGWYISQNKQDETTRWDFANGVVTKDMVLYAGWDFTPDWSGHPIDADDIEVSFKKATYSTMTYTGSYIRPEITVKYIKGSKKVLLKENSDYILKFENNSEVGNAKIIIYGTGEYSGSRELGFIIKEKNINKVNVASIPEFMVSPNLVDEVGNAMNVADGTRLLVYGEDFDISLSQTEVSSPTKVSVTIMGKGNYTGTKSKGGTFLLSPYNTERKNIEEYCSASLSVNKILTFSGKALKPKITVKEGNKNLSSKNYKIVYKDNIEVGTGYAIIYGCNDYCGSIMVPFTIEPKEIGKCKLQVKNTTLYYNGREQKNLNVIVKDGQRTLKEGTDYNITYVGDFKDLTGKVKPYIEIHAIEGGNYKEGSKTLSKKFKIVKGRLNSTASIEAILAGEGISYDSTTDTYKVPVGTEPQILVSYNGELLSGQKYVKKMDTSELSYTYKIPNIKVGKKSNIKITGTNNFSGNVTIKCIGY